MGQLLWFWHTDIVVNSPEWALTSFLTFSLRLYISLPELSCGWFFLCPFIYNAQNAFPLAYSFYERESMQCLSALSLLAKGQSEIRHRRDISTLLIWVILRYTVNIVLQSERRAHTHTRVSLYNSIANYIACLRSQFRYLCPGYGSKLHPLLMSINRQELKHCEKSKQKTTASLQYFL